jgi:biofilm protein TabA
MIVSDMIHIERQISMTSHMKQALSFLRMREIRGLEDGIIEIDGDRIFANVQRYETIAIHAPKFEYHRKYVDIQFIVYGEEIIGWMPAEHVTVVEPYNVEKDICFGHGTAGRWTPVLLQAGQLAVLWPEDGHAPKISPGVPAPVMKIIIKVKV